VSAGNDVFELYNIIPADKNNMELIDVIKALNQIFELSKNNQIDSIKLIRSKNFDLICRKLMSKGLEMNVHNSTECLKILTYLGVRSDCKVINFCLTIIQREINDLSLDQMIFLNFLFKKMSKTPQLEALKIAIPMVLQIQLGLKLDHENVKQLVDLLQFTSEIKVNPQCVNSIVSALSINVGNISPNQAISIIWSLSDFELINKFYERLLRDCLDIVKRNIMDIQFNPLETTLSKLTEKIYSGQNWFYDEQFFDKCVEYTIEKKEGFHRSIYILKKFNRIVSISIF
jgi:hypothetical protein